MIFFKLWRHDLRYGLSKRLLLYLLVAFGQAFLFCKGFSNWIGNMSGLPEIGELSDTFGNYMIYLFQGMDEYVATPDKAFEFPAMWILIFLCGNALTLTYPLRDLEGVGQQLLIRSGRRRHWWLAKCGWEIVSSVVYLLLLWLGVLCYCAIFQIPITLEINEWLVSVMASWEVASPLNSGRSLAVADRRTDAFHDSAESGGTCGRAAPRNDLGVHGGLCHPAAIGILDESMASGELCDVSAQPLADPGDRNGAQSGNLADAGRKPVHDPDRRDILQPEGYSKKGVIRINMKEIQLKVTDVNKKIHGNTILENVSLTMTSGKIYGLQGSNGSGKTMLMRAMCGLIRLNSGTVEMNGKDSGEGYGFSGEYGNLNRVPGFPEWLYRAAEPDVSGGYSEACGSGCRAAHDRTGRARPG